MYNISNLDAVIAFGGFGAGLVIGCGNNVRKTGSLFMRRCDASADVSFVFKNLEVNREKAGFGIKLASDFLKPKIWNPFLPLEHLAPLCLLIISQIFVDALSPNATVAATAALATSYTFKVIVLPLTLNIAVLMGSLFVRALFSNYTEKLGIDPSGHALAQFSSAIYKFVTLTALSRLNLASNPYRMIAAVTTLSDYLWTCHTASNYHSVIDMAVSIIFMGIIFGPASLMT